MSLRFAFVLSLVLHAAMIAWPGGLPVRHPDRPVPRAVQLEAVLVPVPSPNADRRDQPELRLTERPAATRTPSPPRNAVDAAEVPRRRPGPISAEPPRAATTVRLEPLTGEAAHAAMQQVARELLYPEEAVRLGQEGEVLVQLFLDDAGNVIAARLERGSGHRLLDDAAVRAARTVRGLPASAPREAILPVRFRLR